MVFIGPTPGLPITTRMTIAACVRDDRAGAAKNTRLRGDRARLSAELDAARAAMHSRVKASASTGQLGPAQAGARRPGRSSNAVPRIAPTFRCPADGGTTTCRDHGFFGLRPRIEIFGMIARVAWATGPRDALRRAIATVGAIVQRP